MAAVRLHAEQAKNELRRVVGIYMYFYTKYTYHAYEGIWVVGIRI